jgi:thiol-disulfide isomerase/thioredoxin
LLRGQLIELTDTSVQFRSRLSDLVLPRARVTTIISVQEQEAPRPEPTQGDPNVCATLASGAQFSFRADRIADDKLVGEHPLFGACSLPLSAVRELAVGDSDTTGTALAYADWRLRPAKEPEFSADSTGAADGGPGQVFGTDSPLVGMSVEDFQAKLLDGSPFRLSDHTDKIVILDFWATWCGPCVRSMPGLMKTVKEFSGDVLLVGVNQQENTQTIAEFLETRAWDLTVALDPDGDIAKRFLVNAIPQTVIIGKEGTIDRVHVGALGNNLEAELTETLQQLLIPPDTAGEEGKD